MVRMGLGIGEVLDMTWKGVAALAGGFAELDKEEVAVRKKVKEEASKAVLEAPKDKPYGSTVTEQDLLADAIRRSVVEKGGKMKVNTKELFAILGGRNG
jgi:hypothetical protein